MNINDIFGLDKYDEAYQFTVDNAGTTIQDLGNGQYQLVKIIVPIPTVAEQNETIRQNRESLYVQISDKIKADYDEAVARGSSNADELKKAWLESKDKIREENPYIDIIDK